MFYIFIHKIYIFKQSFVALFLDLSQKKARDLNPNVSKIWNIQIWTFHKDLCLVYFSE